MEGTIRPDMWGFAGSVPHVFLANKFWAGLTDNQPISYLHQLAAYPHPTILLVIAPAAREQTLWHELGRRLREGGITMDKRNRSRESPTPVTLESGRCWRSLLGRPYCRHWSTPR